MTCEHLESGRADCDLVPTFIAFTGAPRGVAVSLIVSASHHLRQDLCATRALCIRSEVHNTYVAHNTYMAMALITHECCAFASVCQASRRIYQTSLRDPGPVVMDYSPSVDVWRPHCSCGSRKNPSAYVSCHSRLSLMHMSMPRHECC